MSLRLHHAADPGDPDSMTLEERHDEVAGIFARAVVRLHACALPHVSAEQNPPDFPESSLDLPAPPRPCVDAG